MRAILATLIFCAAPVAAQDFFTLKGHGGPIMDIAVSPTGQIATASFDNSVGLWNGTTPVWLDGHEAAVITVAFTSDNGLVSGGDDFTLRQWGDDTSRVIGTHQAKITAVRVSPSGDIVSASWDHSVRVWPKDGTDPLSLTGHKKGVNDIAISDDGTAIYSASADGTIRFWDLDRPGASRPLVKHGFGVNQLVLNEAAGWLAYGAVDGGTRIIDLETGAQLADLTLGRRPVLSMAFQPETQHLAVGDGEGYIMVVDSNTWRIIKDFKAARNGPIWALAFSQNGENLHAGGIEDIVYSWPVATMAEHAQMATGTRPFLEDPEALPNGERQFKRKCSICHTLTPGSGRRAGPTLYALFGRPAGVVTDYSYSNTLQNSDIVWNEDTIDKLFDMGPDHYIPGSKMPMQRITGRQDRDDLIAYLRGATDPNAATGGDK